MSTKHSFAARTPAVEIERRIDRGEPALARGSREAGGTREAPAKTWPRQPAYRGPNQLHEHNGSRRDIPFADGQRGLILKCDDPEKESKAGSSDCSQPATCEGHVIKA